MSTLYTAANSEPVPPAVEQHLGMTQLTADEIIITQRRQIDHIPLTAIDYLEVSEGVIRLVLVGGSDLRLPAPNEVAAHAFASVVAAALTPSEQRASVGAITSETRVSAFTRYGWKILIALSVIAYPIFGIVVVAVVKQHIPDAAGPVLLAFICSPPGLLTSTALWFRHWKPFLILRRRGITVVGELTGHSYYKGKVLIEKYRFTTVNGQRCSGEENGIRSSGGRIEIVYDPEDPDCHKVRVNAVESFIPYFATLVFSVMAGTLPAALLYVFVSAK